MQRQARVGPSAARDLAKNKIVQFERALEVIWGMGVLQCKPSSWNVEIEEARKFITRSMRRLKERLLSEAKENLKKMLAEQEGEGPQPPSTVTGRNFTDSRSNRW